MSISQQTISRVKDAVDVVDVIGDFVSLKKVGQNYRALSPFTNEKTPSFYVSPTKNIFKCFSSGKGGDAISFVMEIEGLSYPEAIRYLAKKYGIEIEEEQLTDEALEKQSERESLFIVLNFANEYFQKNLFESEEGRSIGMAYFKERGYDERTVKEFELGYSLDKWDDFSLKAIESSYQPDLLEKAGLISVKDGRNFDRFRGRIIFPIHNLAGKTVGFGGRILKKDKKAAKYINSPETEVYQKSKILYGLYKAKQAVREKDNCYLTEGYTDVISLHRAGITNTVSTSGTSLTADQIRLIKRFTKNITVLFDGDSAGIKASYRGIDMLLEEDMNVRVVPLPEGEDPDSCVKRIGSADFEAYLTEQTVDFITFKATTALKEIKQDPIRKAEVIKEIVASITKIPDSVKRSVFFKQCSSLLDIDENTLILESNKIQLTERKRARLKPDAYEPAVEPNFDNYETNFQPKKIETDQTESHEREIIRLLVNYGEKKIDGDRTLCEYILIQTEDVAFQTPIYSGMLETCRREFENGKIVTVDYFLNQDNTTIKNEIVDLISSKYELCNWERFNIYIEKEEDNPAEFAYLALTHLKWLNIRKLIKENNIAILHASTPEEEEQLQKKYLTLKNAERELAGLLGNVITG